MDTLYDKMKSAATIFPVPGSPKLNKVQICFENLLSATKSSTQVHNEKKKMKMLKSRVK